jgi:hypothetical protein
MLLVPFYFMSQWGRKVQICGKINNKIAQNKRLSRKGYTPA